MFRKMILKSVHVPIMGRSKKRKHFIVGVGASPRIRTPCTLLFGPGDFSNLEVSLYSTDPGIRWSNLDENWTVSQVMSFMIFIIHTNHLNFLARFGYILDEWRVKRWQWMEHPRHWSTSTAKALHIESLGRVICRWQSHRFTRNEIGRILLPKKYFNYGCCPILLLQLVPTMFVIVVPGWLVKCVMRA